jgi:hypothetical protein
VVDDISHEVLRALLHDEGVSLRAVKTVKAITDPDYHAMTVRVLDLYAIADGVAAPGPDDPTVVFCVDEFGPPDGGVRRAHGRAQGKAQRPAHRDPARRCKVAGRPGIPYCYVHSAIDAHSRLAYSEARFPLDLSAQVRRDVVARMYYSPG